MSVTNGWFIKVYSLNTTIKTNEKPCLLCFLFWQRLFIFLLLPGFLTLILSFHTPPRKYYRFCVCICWFLCWKTCSQRLWAARTLWRATPHSMFAPRCKVWGGEKNKNKKKTIMAVSLFLCARLPCVLFGGKTSCNKNLHINELSVRLSFVAFHNVLIRKLIMIWGRVRTAANIGGVSLHLTIYEMVILIFIFIPPNVVSYLFIRLMLNDKFCNVMKQHGCSGFDKVCFPLRKDSRKLWKWLVRSSWTAWIFTSPRGCLLVQWWRRLLNRDTRYGFDLHLPFSTF